MNRYALGGFYDRVQERPGPVSGSGPNFEKALSDYAERLRRQALPGTWRCGDNRRQFKNNGTFIDRDWAIINY